LKKVIASKIQGIIFSYEVNKFSNEKRLEVARRSIFLRRKFMDLKNNYGGLKIANER